jgi:hypothetical protein
LREERAARFVFVLSFIFVLFSFRLFFVFTSIFVFVSIVVSQFRFQCINYKLLYYRFRFEYLRFRFIIFATRGVVSVSHCRLGLILVNGPVGESAIGSDPAVSACGRHSLSAIDRPHPNNVPAFDWLSHGEYKRWLHEIGTFCI